MLSEVNEHLHLTVNEMIKDNSFDVIFFTESWLKPTDYFGHNESTPPGYCYKHEQWWRCCNCI